MKQALDDIQTDVDRTLSAHDSWFEGLAGAGLFWVYGLLGICLIPIWAPIVLIKYGFGRAIRQLSERVTPGGIPPSKKPRLWFHAASIGEWQALRPLIKNFQEEKHFSPFVTVSTVEAKKLASQQEPGVSVRVLPLDLPLLIDAFVRNLRPQALILVETEIWPFLVRACTEQHVPILLVNGRLSPRSLALWRLLKPFAARLMNQISWFFVRSDRDAKNFCALKASSLRMTVTGNVKSDSLKILSWEEKLRRRKELFKNQEGLWILAGSTWPGEEELMMPLLAQKFSKKIRLILAPRRPERFKEVERLLESHPYSWSKWSLIKNIGEWTTDVLLIDTLGELKDLYAVADIAFIGGTVYPKGGQNPLEPASSRVPMVFGPSMENFQDEALEFKNKGAARQIRNQADLFSDMKEMIEDDSLRRSMGEAAAAVVASKQGAVARTVQGIKELLSI